MLCIVWYLRKRIANLFFHYCLFSLAQWRTPHDILGPALFHPAWNLILSVFAFLVHTAGEGGHSLPWLSFLAPGHAGLPHTARDAPASPQGAYSPFGIDTGSQPLLNNTRHQSPLFLASRRKTRTYLGEGVVRSPQWLELSVQPSVLCEQVYL